jgi:8-oxo-dGTP pyrophosphatase MutT (NUDIX family)
MTQTREVVSCFLECEGCILLLKRSQEVGSYRRQWATVSGYIEQQSPDEQALIEIAEEVSLGETDIILLKKGEPLEVLDEDLDTRWVIHPYLFRVEKQGKICLDWEHEEYRWIEPDRLGDYDTVPKLKESLAKVWSG